MKIASDPRVQTQMQRSSGQATVPFALEKVTPTPMPIDDIPLRLRYIKHLQRNEVNIDGQWVDVVEAAERHHINPLVVGTHGATMTEMKPGGYKLDDDK